MGRLMFVTMSLLIVLMVPMLARASESSGGHGAEGTLLVLLAVALAVAKVGGALATRLRQPSVLGELLAGVVLGGLHQFGVVHIDIAADPTVDMLARLGAVVLLFQVGLESTVPQMLRVGARATGVAVVGVVLPTLLGIGLGLWLRPEAPFVFHLFLGSALCATSVGITARVFQEFGGAQSPEARIVMGAAVVDDVLGLVVLTVVSGLAMGSGGVSDVGRIVLYASLFLGGALLVGPRLSGMVFRASARLRTSDVLLPVSLAFGFGSAALAGAIGLAPIVGAYAAGLVLERTHYEDLVTRGEHELEELVRPVGQLLIPLFFVLMGARVDLRSLASPEAWVLGAALVAAAIPGKIACGWAVPATMNRWVVGLGMIPRGEVGLIFADAGRALLVGGQPLLGAVEYTAIVLMVLATTLVTPPLLGRVIRRSASTSG